jgi:hypothetical protein
VLFGVTGVTYLRSLFRFRVFVSYRINEVSNEAEMLEAALARRNIKSFVSHLEPAGNSIEENVVEALVGCKLFVILGTKSFGEKTDVGFSTYNELEFARDESKPLFLVKFFDGEFKHAVTRFRLPKSVPFVFWQPGAAVPAEVVEGIAAELAVL